MCRKGEDVWFGPVRFTHRIETLSSLVCSSHRQGEVSYSIPTDADRSAVSRLFPPFATSIPIFPSRRSFKDDFISSQPPRHLIKCLLKREPEASATVETLTSFLFIRNSPPGQNPSHTERLGEKDRRVSVDKPGTRPSTDAHARQTAYLHANMPRAHLRKSKHTHSCARGFGKQREIKGSDYRGRWGGKEKKSAWLNEHAARQNTKTCFDKSADRSWRPSSQRGHLLALY